MSLGFEIRQTSRASASLAVVLVCLWGGTLGAATATEDAIRRYEQMLLHQPGDYAVYTKLGSLYLLNARETGDTRYYALAEKAFRESLEIGPKQNPQASTFLAAVLYATHQFGKAGGYAERAIAMAPADSYPYGILGDVYQQRGEYARAAATYHKMLDLDPSLFSHARIAQSQWLHGNVEGAVRHIGMAITLGIERDLPKEHIAWARKQLGDVHFNAGDLGEAQKQYSASLKASAGYHLAIAGLARVRLAQSRYEEAIELYRDALDSNELPHYAAALGDIYRKLGRREDATQHYHLVGELVRRTPLNERLYNRQFAYFLADHDMQLLESLVLARKELKIRQDIYTYDALAWTLYKNGRLQEALASMKEVLKLGTRDARLFFHAGMIYLSIGDTDQARDYLTLALATNPFFDLFDADLAQATLQEIEEPSAHS